MIALAWRPKNVGRRRRGAKILFVRINGDTETDFFFPGGVASLAAAGTNQGPLAAISRGPPDGRGDRSARFASGALSSSAAPRQWPFSARAVHAITVT